MNLLSKISYLKIHYLGMMIEIRSMLNVLGFMSDKRTKIKNRDDVFKVVTLVPNLNWKDSERLIKYSEKHPVKRI